MPRALPSLLLVALLAGCTSGPDVPEESAFAAGTCRTAAPDVRAVGEVLPELDDEDRVEDPVKEALREAQERLDAVAGGADPEVGAALSDLVVAIGLVRIRADGGTYEPALGESLTRSYEQVLAVCTAR